MDLQEVMAVQKAGHLCRPAIHLLAMTTTVDTIVHPTEHTRQAMTILATTIIRHITANHLPTGAVTLPLLLPAMHLHILVRYNTVSAFRWTTYMNGVEIAVLPVWRNVVRMSRFCAKLTKFCR